MVTASPAGSISQSLTGSLPLIPRSQPPAAHLVGICGSGMKALAELLTGLGWKLSGSDLQPASQVAEALTRRGLRIHQGHHGRFLPAELDVLVYSPAIGPKNPERQQATQRGIRQLSYGEMLGQLMSTRTGICVAGTHGKSTTTAMTGFVLTDAGHSPSVVIGAELCESGMSGWAGTSPLMVVESCEYQRTFLNFKPRHAAILALEADHFDCFSGIDQTIAAFSDFSARVPRDGTLLIPAGCAASRRASTLTSAPVQTFGFEPQANWWAADLRTISGGTRFRVFHDGEYFAEISLRLHGEHNVLNALAATALCHENGATPLEIREGLHNFPGIRRRFELVGTWRGISLVDDYAHHPTAVRATLKAARERFPGRRVWCVFQPHQVSRTNALLQEFSQSFGDAGQVLVVPVFAARERVNSEPEEISQLLAQLIADHGTDARYSGTLDQTLATLDDELRPGDVLITMGAGNISKVHHAFTRRIQRNHSTR